MSLFGIPIIISYDYYLEFLTNNFSSFTSYELLVNSSSLIPLYIFINFLYLWFMFRIVVPFIYKMFIWFNNCFLDF